MITYIIWLHLKPKNVYIGSVCEYFELVSLSSSMLWPNHAFMQSKKNNRSIKLSITEFQSFASFVPSSCDGRDSIHPTKTKLQTRNNVYLVLYTWIGFVWFMIFAMEQLSFLCILGFQLYFLFWCDLFPIYVKLFICWKICNILTCFI